MLSADLLLLSILSGFAVLSAVCAIWCLSREHSALLTHKRMRDSETDCLALAGGYAVLLHWRANLRARVIRVGQLLFRFRDYLFPFALVIAATVTEPGFPLRSERVAHWLDGVGLLLGLVGQGCRLLAVSSAYNIRRGGRHKQVAANKLIQDGFFAHTRNPLYLGNLLIAVGLVCIADSPAWFFVILPLTIGMYCAVVLAEEVFLTARFGQVYIDYCRRVRRFLPTLRGLRDSLSASGVNWKRAFWKEARIFNSWVSYVFGLLIWKQWKIFGFTARRVEIVALAAAWVVTIGIVAGGGWRLKNTTQS